MTESNIITIAKKEFFDHIRSRKFLLIFCIFLIIAIVGIIDGVSNYYNMIQLYNELQQQISLSDIPAMDIPHYVGDRPSILMIFNMMSMTMIPLGAILGIAMGFDLLSKEKESKSLKILLAHPVYRDEVINGKALGGITVIFLALGIVMILSLAVLLIFGIVPEGTELILLVFFSIISLAYIFTYFAIALFISAITEESGAALIYVMIIYIILSIFIPVLMSNSSMNVMMMGSPPEMPNALREQLMAPSGNANDTTSSGFVEIIGGIPEKPGPELEEYQKKVEEYSQKQSMILNLLYLITPNMNYDKISTAITMPHLAKKIYGSSSPSGSSDEGFKSSSMTTGVSIPDTLELVWRNILALLIFPSIFFGLAYVSFMRLDIR